MFVQAWNVLNMTSLVKFKESPEFEDQEEKRSERY